MIHIFVVVAVFSSVVCSLRLGDIECSAELLSITEGGDGVDGGRSHGDSACFVMTPFPGSGLQVVKKGFQL